MASKKDKVKDSDRFSIIVPRLDRCMICGTDQRVCLHEVFYGTANRKKSKEDGMIVPLCFHHHQETGGIHTNKELDLKVKQNAQKVWMKEYGEGTDDEKISQFIHRYGRNYLD